VDKIEEYWNVKPPMNGKGAVGTLEWSLSIIADRYKFAPYLKRFMKWKDYKGKHVLEIGCGAGSDTIALAEAGAHVVSLDITDTAVSVTENRVKLHNVDATVLKYDGRKLSCCGDQDFDLVYSCGVLHHTPYMEDLLSECRRVLRDDGTLKLMLYHRNSLLYYYSILYKHIKAGTAESREELLSRYSEFREGCPYTRCFSRQEISEILERQGFCGQTIYTDSVVYDDEHGRKLDGSRRFDIEKTGIYDIDQFFKKYNENVEFNLDLSEWGWHLLVEATKGRSV
jgi:ubiquinone/menaquinone biosynthesis C-methylase UbiE